MPGEQQVAGGDEAFGRRAPGLEQGGVAGGRGLAVVWNDAAYGAETEFGERLVNSMWTLSTLVGLSVAQLTMGTIVANLGFSEISFPAPMKAGDTLYAETTVEDKRESKSRPGQGIVTLRHTGRNQHGDVVAVAVRQTLVKCAPAS